MCSYAYYICDAPVISDGLFDKICVDLLKKWDSITHRHKDLITKADLRAGTCLISKYPGIVIGAVENLMRKTPRQHSRELKNKTKVDSRIN